MIHLYSVLAGMLGALIMHVILHRIRVATSRSRSYDKCWEPVARTDTHMALCLRPKYHRGQHAAALSDIVAAGYERAPF